ncbi:ATP-binding protein [Streptomyces sp. NBC_00555]|uniref:ATP-binding protein n=1 Tax=Streptomyces sp. NBC_00555 TaxID=2903662 RepID=UPI0022570E7C|nr:ATP-binding protein [Streptomyces sp. NBC_00555]MCX5011668.1 ATP-binding protein [Streptomyces sp. NBC_00555]
MDHIQGQADPEEQSGGAAGLPPALPATASKAGHAPAPAPVGPARVVTLTAGEFTLTVNPVDGSEIEPLRPGTRPGRPAKRDAAARTARAAAARPPVLPGPPVPARPLLEREEERERLVRLLGRGRSVRLTGPSGSGRTALLDAVAAQCTGLAPDGVVRLSGHGHQQPAELLQTLYATVYEASDQRPDRIELLARVRDIGVIVLLDDLEMGGPALDELLHATPECAYLLAATPETRSPSDDSHIEEVFLGGLGKADCLELLETRLGRPLTDLETAWASDLRFASEGLPLRFVQAAALLRQRDELNHTAEDDDEEEPGVFDERPRDAVEVPLPTLAEGAAPAELLASRVSESARAALRIACALGGELPHHAHLPALVGDTHADSAVSELLDCGLLTPVGTRYRLAAGVARQLEEVGYGDTAAEEARTAARHYAWWTGHSSVTPERVAAEADAVLCALSGADVVAAVLLARTAAPAFAASRHWEAWERVLRSGAEAARKAGEVAEQAYFHHELGVLALCEGRLDRARAELETSIGLRGALADKRGTVAGRRALALVVDREAAEVAASPPLRLEAPALPPAAAPAALPPAPPTAAAGFPGQDAPKAVAAPVAPVAPAAPVSSAKSEAVTRVAPVVPVIRRQEPPTTLSEVFEDAFPISPKPEPAPAPRPAPQPAHDGAARRRRVLLAGAGALAVVALGTVVSLAMSSSDTSTPPAQSPAVSGTKTRSAPPVVPGASGNDPAPEPSDPAAPPSESATPGETTSPTTPGRTPSRTPSRRPQSTPPQPPTSSSVSPPPTSAEPSASPTPTETAPPSPTATSGTGTGTASATAGGTPGRSLGDGP